MDLMVKLKIKDACHIIFIHMSMTLLQVVMNMVANTENPALLAAHGSTESLKQTARRFARKKLPDIARIKDIKVRIWNNVFLTSTLKFLHCILISLPPYISLISSYQVPGITIYFCDI